MTVDSDTPDDGFADFLSFLGGSQCRLEMLAALSGEAELSKRAFRARLDASRPTILRNLGSLADAGLITETVSGYALTAKGDAVAREIDELRAAHGELADVERFLEHVPATALDIDPRRLFGANVVAASPNAPFAPMDRMLQLRREADRVRELTSVVANRSATQLHDRVDSGAIDAELVLTRATLTNIRENDGYEASFEDLLGSDNASVRVYDGTVPVLIALLDRTAVLGTTDDDGSVAALLVSDDPVVYEWAESTYRRYRDAAVPISE